MSNPLVPGIPLCLNSTEGELTMSKIKIAALAATLVMAIPVFAQDNTTTTTTTTTVQTAPPSTTQVDQARANQQAAETLGNPDVHWTIKERTELLMDAPYVRPRDMWEISHMFHMMPSNTERVVFEGVTNALRANAGNYYTNRAMMDTYWQNRMNGTVTTTVTTTTADANSPTTMTGNMNNMATAAPYGDSTNMRQQGMTGAGMAVGTGLGEVEAWELMLRDLNAQDRTTFRMAWNNMTSGQQEALLNIVRQSSYYFNARNAGRYGYFMPY